MWRVRAYRRASQVLRLSLKYPSSNYNCDTSSILCNCKVSSAPCEESTYPRKGCFLCVCTGVSTCEKTLRECYCYPLSVSTMFPETGSPTEPGVCHFYSTGWSVKPLCPSSSATLELLWEVGFEACITLPSFYEPFGNLNSGSCASVSGTSFSKPSP